MQWDVKPVGKKWKRCFAWLPVQALTYNNEVKLKFKWIWLEYVYKSDATFASVGVFRDYSIFPYERTVLQ